MKIALVILHADAGRGGAERYTLDLAAGLVQRGHDVSILATSFQDQPTPGTRVLIRTSGLTRTGRFQSFRSGLLAHFIASVPKFDVIHAMLPIDCDIYHPHAGVAAEALQSGHLQKSGALQTSLAWIGNRFNSRRKAFALKERTLLAGSDPPTVLCLSNQIKDVLKRHYPTIPEKKLVSLFNGIDLQRFDPEKNPQARQTVRGQLKLSDNAVMGLMLAQDFERKGLRQAIEALARVADPKIILVVGGNPDPSKYQKLAASLGITDRMRFVGPVAQPADFYRAADFFLLPTFFDPCSLVVLEALVMGLPVISTAKNGACEIMTDGVHGKVLRNPADIPTLTQAIEAMADPGRRADMSLACLQLRPALSQHTHVSSVESVYADVKRVR